MTKAIKINKAISRKQLDDELANVTKSKLPIDLSKYFGKVKFGSDGLDYQFEVGSERDNSNITV